MKRIFLLIIILVLFIGVSAVNAQEGLTVTIPDDPDTIPPITWNPDNWVLIIVVGFVLALGTLAGVVTFLGNKLYNSAPQWAQPGIENTVRSGVADAIETGQTIVLKTPTPLDDYALQMVEQQVNEALARIFRRD